MAPEVQSALLAGMFGVIVAAIGLLGRRGTKSTNVVRRSLTRQERLESYAFTLRRQLNGAGIVPHRWPAGLEYLRRDDPDPDQEDTDDEQ